MCSSVSSTIVQTWRERSPSSYSLKIQNFSQLKKSTLSSDGQYQSRLFSSGGYNWRMIIYPNGNNKDNGSGFISMYVEIDGKSLMSTPPSEVFADFRFFVFNKNENKYFTIQDVESKPFNNLRPVWGLPQVLQFVTFNDPKNGYIFGGDQFEFGVDVIVAPPPTKWESISFDAKLINPKFSWTIKNFSKLEYVYTSNSFAMGGSNWGWQMIIHLSVLAESETLAEDHEKIFAQGHIRILDPVGLNNFSCELLDWHDKSNTGWGWDQFVSTAELRKTYLDEDGTLNVEIEFEVVSTTKYSLL
ncbi:MATH/TRAF domain [Arabidopsis thaliana x Arabidopsis arenosa]|uniref:MATH/TRAF domain n=1 Tax=Arabidopsis thaliana x Arabidopsis arenosa TaxID=1240361 RepID=A0A8T2A2C9_9BRAS|nr:MATH/TRAF domain [Arabidopsis thaliana x Arabidopsis arenosa]